MTTAFDLTGSSVFTSSVISVVKEGFVYLSFFIDLNTVFAHSSHETCFSSDFIPSTEILNSAPLVDIALKSNSLFIQPLFPYMLFRYAV